MEGSDSSLLSDSAKSDELYPSIRKLPLLGVEWADLFRRAKIQETVFGLLTQQYEIARIQEAKEIPTVNVVDSANVPEKKSWPPRLLLIAVLTVLSLVGASVWIIGRDRWHQMDPEDPGKVFTESVWRETSNHLRKRSAPAIDRLRLSRLFGRNGQQPSK